MNLNSLNERLDTIDPTAASRLKEISAAIDNDELGYLSAVDIYGAINPAGIESRAAEQIPGLWSLASTVISVLEWIRNFLVLVPITLTWASFWFASRDYAAALSKDSSLNNSSFLYLWETGYGNVIKPSFFSFSQTAFLAASTLMLILLLTVMIHFWKDIVSNLTAKRAAHLRQSLEGDLWEIEKQLSAKRYRQTEMGTLEELSETVKQFTTSSTRLDKSVKLFETKAAEVVAVTEALDVKIGALVNAKGGEVDDLTNFNRGLKGTVKQMVDQVSQASLVYQDLQSSISALASSTTRASQVEERLLERVSSVEANMKDLAAGTRDLVQSVQGALTELHISAQGDNELSRSAVATVSQVTDLFAGQIDLRKNLDETEKRLEGIALGLQSAVRVLNDLPAQLQAPVLNLTNEATRLSQTTADLTTKQANALQDIVTHMNGEIANSVRGSMSDLQLELANMNQINARQSATLQSIGKDVSQATKVFLDRALDFAATLQELNKDQRQIVFPWWRFTLATGFSVFISVCVTAALVLSVVRFSAGSGLPFQPVPASTMTNSGLSGIPPTQVRQAPQETPTIIRDPSPIATPAIGTTPTTLTATPIGRPTWTPAARVTSAPAVP